MATVRGEGDNLPARCISLLQEVKDLIEEQKSASENTDQTVASISSERQARPLSSTVQQQQGDNATQQRVMQNFRSLFTPYSAACSSSAFARPPAKKNLGPFRSKRPGLTTFSVSGPHKLQMCRHVGRKLRCKMLGSDAKEFA